MMPMDYHPRISQPSKFFDSLIGLVDLQSKHLLENYTDILNRDAVPMNIEEMVTVCFIQFLHFIQN